MLQQIIEFVQSHPLASTSSGFLVAAASEGLGFTKKGGFIRGIGDLLISLGRAIVEFRKARDEIKKPENPTGDAQ